LNQDATNNDPDNLAFMCLEHHDWFDSKTSQSKGSSAAEARHYREELYEELLRRDEAGDAEEAQSTVPPPFQPIDAIDENLQLRWIIRTPPDRWVTRLDPFDRHSRVSVKRILDGPFHAVADCNERLALYGWDREPVRTGRKSPLLRDECPGCKVLLFRSNSLGQVPVREVPLWTVREEAFAELQRLHRSGIPIEGPRVVLQKPQYWDVLVPP
jgi:hypothetical protein